MIRVGPAGWSYPDWDGKVWPRSKPKDFHGLAFLARYVTCMEVNSSFYALPQAKHCGRWASLLEPFPGFALIMKLHQSFTHGAWDETAAKDSARKFLDALVPLERAKLLHAVLVQFPITFLHGRDEVLRLGRIRRLFENQTLVLEMRHRSWFDPPALHEIRGLGYSLAYIDLPDAWNHPPKDHPPTGPVGYLRLHGRNEATWFAHDSGRDQRYDYLYSPPEIGQIAYRVDAIAKRSETTYVVTNNHFEGKAVANALELRYLLEGRKPVAAPATLVANYPHLAPITVPEGQGRLF
ncbi:MAG: DUF72 domain-containing protein [Planctomycetes bacterium]|nr:DUF72 domain-containing protein [Planctomycetota bacterium]HPF15151.1 DUF72 domain-containing protein [Planctomycetota bacterium]